MCFPLFQPLMKQNPEHYIFNYKKKKKEYFEKWGKDRLAWEREFPRLSFSFKYLGLGFKDLAYQKL